MKTIWFILLIGIVVFAVYMYQKRKNTNASTAGYTGPTTGTNTQNAVTSNSQETIEDILERKYQKSLGEQKG